MSRLEERQSILERLDDWALDYVPGPIYRIPVRIKDFMYSVKYFFQKLFRKSHTSDREIWNLHHYMAKSLYPKLKAFKDSKRVGYPGIFSEYHENEWKNREEYDKALAEGKLEGGGPDAWEKVLDEVLFAFDWFLSEEDVNDDFYKRWELDNPHEEIEENLNISYWYSLPGGGALSTSEELSQEELDKRGATFKNTRKFYFNVKKHMEYAERAQKGFELFGKHFMSFWD